MADMITTTNRALDPASDHKFGVGGRVERGEFLPAKPGTVSAGFRDALGAFHPVAKMTLLDEHFAGGQRPVLRVRVSASILPPEPKE